MTAPEDRMYCGNPYCDGDHLYAGQACDPPPSFGARFRACFIGNVIAVALMIGAVNYFAGLDLNGDAPDTESITYTATGTALRTWYPCRAEDGAGQRRCVWDGRHMGDHHGRSVLIYHGGTDRTRIVFVSHRRAHRLMVRGY